VGALKRHLSTELTKEAQIMLWLIVAIILFVIAIAGGAIVHPILFALGIVALVLAVMHFRRAAY
jgi:hypothetical protein